MSLIARIKSFVKEEAVWRGQLISVLVAGSGIFATFLSEQKPRALFPLFMSTLYYSLLFLFVIFRYHLNSQNDTHALSDLAPSRLRNSWKLYLLAGFLDVEANFCVTLAYNYTSITSIMLLDCFTIPCCMLLSRIFLGAKYLRSHFIGTGLAILGTATIIFDDSKDKRDMDEAVLGDILVLIGVALYACSNVLQEGVMKGGAREEYLSVMPFFATFISLVQMLVLEKESLSQVEWTADTAGFIVGFVLCLVFFYLNVSKLLAGSDAVLFNLSLLTSDVYAVLFSFAVTGEWVSFLYIIAFVFVTAGIYVYHLEESPTDVDSVTQGLRERLGSAACLTGGDDAVPTLSTSAGHGESIPADKYDQLRLQFHEVGHGASAQSPMQGNV